jgi:hypothetical protein
MAIAYLSASALKIIAGRALQAAGMYQTIR